MKNLKHLWWVALLAVSIYAGVEVNNPGVGGVGTFVSTSLSNLLAVSTSAGNQAISELGTLSFGNGDPLLLYRDGNDGYVVSLTGNLNLTGAGVFVPTPSSGSSATTKTYVDSIFLGATPTNVLWQVNGGSGGYSMALNIIPRGGIGVILTNVAGVMTLYLTNSMTLVGGVTSGTTGAVSQTAAGYSITFPSPFGPSTNIWIAKVTQGGISPPTAVVMYNTLGGTIAWSYDSSGVYRGVLTNKLGATSTNFWGIAGSSIDNLGIRVVWDGISQFTVRTAGDGSLSDTPIQLMIFQP